jgi:alkylation response protein AidB-like acyl-CoA dehydrogenase
MTNSTSFDLYLEPWLTARVPRIAEYSRQLADFYDWVRTEVDAQANYTDRYAPPALETYDRNGEVVNRVVANRWYDQQHQELYRRGIIGLPYAEQAPHLLTFAMGYVLSQADISLHCPVTLTGAVAYVLSAHAPDAVRQQFLYDVARMDGLAKTGGTWATEQHGGSDVGATTTTAVQHGDRFALHGLKWFTSNANSGLALATARPQGGRKRDGRAWSLPRAQSSGRWWAQSLSHPSLERQARHQRASDRRDRITRRGSCRSCCAS